MTQITTLAFILGAIGLFWLNRDRSNRTSAALWIPVTWLAVAGSRPLSAWLQIDGSTSRVEQYTEGSAFDRNFWLVLVAIALIIALQRSTAVAKILRNNAPACLFLFYCALSIAWSDYPDIAFKRWIKFLGDFTIILIILTEVSPLAALKQVLSRLAFLLLPTSILFIKYYPELGRSYAAHWEGTQFFTGVAQDKNMLGMTCVICGVSGAWQFLEEFIATRRKRILLAQGLVFSMALFLLVTCNSMTSLSCFLLVSIIMAAHALLRLARRRIIVHAMVFSAILICFAPLFLGLGGGLISSLGRDPTLSGRTQLWHDILNMHVSPLVGTGFESFWLGSRLVTIWHTYWWQPIEAHNGYIETYINLGGCGLCLLALLVVTGYRNVLAALRFNPEAGRVRVAFFVIGIAYNFTEAAIHTQSLVWIFFVLSILSLPAPPDRISAPAAVAIPAPCSPTQIPRRTRPWKIA